MKTNRKAAAVLTAGLLALSISPCFGMTAFAGETDSYTITVSETQDNYAYKAYQIFKGDVETKDKVKVLSHIDWAAGMQAKSAQFLEALKGEAVFNNAFKDAVNAEDVATALKGITDQNQLAVFAKLAKANMSGEGTANGTKTEEGYPISVTGSGYYLVEETGIPAGDPAGKGTVYSRFMMDVVGDASVEPKRDLPSLDKKITGPNADATGKANQVSIGDAVHYEIDTDMPDMTGYSKYYYVINDTLAEGLTFVPSSVVVKINNVKVDENVDYVVQTEDDAAPYTFQIVFKDFIDRTEAKDAPIVVTYDAILNENADRSTDGNLNTADLTYSNNPNEDYDGTPPEGDEPGPNEVTGKTPEKQTKTYTANIKLKKVDIKNNKLTGAKFSIAGESATAVMLNEKIYKEDAAGEYYMLKDGTYTKDVPTKDTEADYDNTEKKYKEVTNIQSVVQKQDILKEAYVNANGELEFGGLGAGTYTITELIAPEGYNLLKDPITVEIEANDLSFAAPNWTAKQDGAEEATALGEDATYSFNVVNSAETTLPSTGGIGNKIFYVLGAIFAIGSGIYLVTRKRMAGVEQ